MERLCAALRNAFGFAMPEWKLMPSGADLSMEVAGGSPSGLAEMPPDIIIAILTATGSDDAAAAASLCETCSRLRCSVMSLRTAVTLRQIGHSWQIAPLLGRLTGLAKRCRWLPVGLLPFCGKSSSSCGTCGTSHSRSRPWQI